LSGRRIGHGAPRAIDEERPMPMPAAFRGDRGLRRLAQVLQKVCEHAAGECRPGLTGGGGAAGEAGEMRKMATGRIPMQDLQQKQLDRDHRVEEAVTPRRVACDLTGSTDRVGVQLGGPIRFEAVQDSHDTGDHGGSPIRKRGELTILPEDRRAFQSS
jgi:hypothetical protein